MKSKLPGAPLSEAPSQNRIKSEPFLIAPKDPVSIAVSLTGQICHHRISEDEQFPHNPKFIELHMPHELVVGSKKGE
jgi:hypothetical protein